MTSAEIRRRFLAAFEQEGEGAHGLSPTPGYLRSERAAEPSPLEHGLRLRSAMHRLIDASIPPRIDSDGLTSQRDLGHVSDTSRTRLGHVSDTSRRGPRRAPPPASVRPSPAPQAGGSTRRARSGTWPLLSPRATASAACSPQTPACLRAEYAAIRARERVWVRVRVRVEVSVRIRGSMGPCCR